MFSGSALVQGFTKSFGMIFASEIGDKTFFIAALMAMKNPRGVVFAGCAGALVVMTVLSTMLGWAAPALLSKSLTHWAAVILFFYFGLRSLYDAITEKEDEASELAEVEEELAARNSKSKEARSENSFKRLFSPIFLEAFTLTFLAEWGDRSQIATIGLAANSDVLGVTLGGGLGHILCTAAAVLGGKQLASHIDERTVGIVGGVMFLIFGVLELSSGTPQ